MNETTEDLERLQRLLDDSYGRAGGHLAGIHTERVRVDAKRLVHELQGMQILVLATVSQKGRPFTGPVDAFFHRARWRFGTSPDALRARHLARSPWVSATHVRGEALVVTVHGRARPIDLTADDEAFTDLLRAQYGAEWVEEHTGAAYYEIEPERMLAADMSRHLSG